MESTTVEFSVEMTSLNTSGRISANRTAMRMMPPAKKKTGFERE